MATPAPTSSSKLNCLCGAITLPGTYLKDENFPISSYLCHCNPCRYTSGGLVPAFADLTGPPPQDIMTKLTSYQFTQLCIRYFCSTCGSHCFVTHPHKENEWYCTAGIIEPPPAVIDVVQLTGHTYISDTFDASIVPFFLPLTANNAQELYANAYGVEKLCPSDLDRMLQVSRSITRPGGGEALSVKCHCGGIDLQIKRADYASEPEHVRTLMNPRHPHEYLARFCTCRSCRLSMGFSLCPWTYTSLSAVTGTKSGTPVVFGRDAEKQGANEGLNLRHHQSSEGTWRSFCGTCGASVFYYTDKEERKDVIDIAVGLLRAASGSMGRGWLGWADGEVSHGQEGVDQAQVKLVERLGRIE